MERGKEQEENRGRNERRRSGGEEDKGRGRGRGRKGGGRGRQWEKFHILTRKYCISRIFLESKKDLRNYQYV